MKPAISLAAVARFRSSLAFRLSGGYALAGFVLVFLAAASLYLMLVKELERSTDEFLADKVHVLRTMLRERPDDSDALREEIELESEAREYEHFYIRLLDEHNTPLLTTPEMADELDLSRFPDEAQAAPEPEKPMPAASEPEESGHEAPERSVPASVSIKGRHGHAFRIATARARVGETGAQTDTVQVAIDVSQQEELLGRFRLWFWTILLTAFIVFPVVGYYLARRGIHPVEEIAATARRISSTNLLERIGAEGYPLELAALAGTFNQMLDRLQESFERISRFSGDIAHDLRTPVNNIRGEAEVALARARTVEEYRDVLESSLEEAVRLSDLIGNLLFLARTESPLGHLHWERVDVTELLQGLCEYYEATASEAGIALRTKTSAGPVIAELDRVLMQRSVDNLISNAVAHTPPGGSVELSACIEGASIRIDVADTGVGIPAEALPRVFDRFFRVDSSRSQASGGTGLGLAIVQGIVSLHGGTAEISSQPGRGTTVTLRIHTTATR